MAVIGGQIGYELLRFIAPRSAAFVRNTGEPNSDTKLDQFFGETLFHAVEGKVVIDFGCGFGNQTVEVAQRGAAKVIGIDIREQALEAGREKAIDRGVSDRCVFATETCELADIIISKDAFEHFADPTEILRLMALLLKPEGYVLAAFGPTWLHPYGGHLFSIFPWSHLIFSEKTQIRWRAEFKDDGATKFSEVDGGLNQLTIGKFERIVAGSPFRIEWLETVPIRGVAFFKTKALREIGSSVVRCKLVLK